MSLLRQANYWLMSEKVPIPIPMYVHTWFELILEHDNSNFSRQIANGML